MTLDELKTTKDQDIVLDMHDGMKIWTFSSGEKASKWNEFKTEGIIAIGWDDVGDLTEYRSKSEIKNKLNQLYGTKSSHVNDSHALWQFNNDIKIGDYIIAKKGSKTILGLGVVTSDYSFDNQRNDFKHIRKIEWKKIGQWTTDDKFAVKTLTDITPYKDFYDKLINIINDNKYAIQPENDIKLSNAKFIKWFKPVIDALKELGRKGTPKQVKDIIHREIELNKISKNKEILEYNNKDIDFARLYLRFAGIIDGTEHGIWKLTDYGCNVMMTDEMATEILKKREQFGEAHFQDDKEINHWWLTANPKIWSFNDIKIGQEVEYTSVNRNGNKRKIYKNFEDVKVDDIVIGYESNPEKAIVAICKITQIHDGKRIIVEKVKNVIPIKYNDIISIDELKNMEFLKMPQGSLFKLTKDEFIVIENLINNQQIAQFDPYLEQDFLNEVFITSEQYDEITFILKSKKNIILQGAPGVGKTFAAKRLAYSLIGRKDNSKIEMIQFHQNYSYEDFVMGYRPSENNKFELRTGTFYNFCLKAVKDPSNNYYFIIDEINRGNLSKIFGELLMLIEFDKRGEQNAVRLTYQPDGSPFSVPENLHIIGMMNTADRSLAMIDYALRRRFCFIEMEPAFQSNQFKEHLKKENVEQKMIDKIIKQISALNQVIEQDNNLGKGFRIGHSYFCNPPESADENWYNKVIKYEIIPLLEEYWFDNEDDVKKHKSNLQG